MAGVIVFFKDDDFGGNAWSLSGLQAYDLNLKKYPPIPNDEIRSAKLSWLPKGSLLRVYDDPKGGTGDDWTEVEVRRTAAEIGIPKFDPSFENEDVKVIHHHKNGIQGKISHVWYQPGKSDALEYKVARRLHDEVGGWHHKGGAAIELASQGSNYRMWRPDISEENGGAFISMKMDHIRGGGSLDDHAQINLHFGADGSLLPNSEWKVRLAGSHPSRRSGDRGEGGAVVPNEWAQLGAKFVEMAGKLVKVIEDMGERGGRANFPAVIQHKVELVTKAVVESLA
ncbi:MAG: hypothetical protein R3F14_04635 [Polyangiaceae bacterium]